MKCGICGFTNAPQETVCLNCGQPLPVERLDDAPSQVLRALRDGMFLAICILITVAAGLKVLAGDGFDVIYTLLTVFLWLTYTQAQKGIADSKHLRCISGTVYANYVITFVAAVLVAVLGSVLALALAALGGNTNQWNGLLDMLGEDVLGGLSQVMLGLAGGVLLLVSAVVSIGMIVVNIFSMRYIHRFAKSLYQSVDNGVLRLQHSRAAKIWLFVSGGILSLSAVVALCSAQLIGAACDGAAGAAAILAGLMIGKYFPE